MHVGKFLTCVTIGFLCIYPETLYFENFLRYSDHIKTSNAA